jgi:protoporphyrinogen oxidase
VTEDTLILGAGMTGLAVGLASGLPVVEAEQSPGGICLSYYMRPGGTKPLPHPPPDGEAYRFENGGGHWIFGGDPAVLYFIRRSVRVQSYVRRSSVFFPDSGRYVPYPIQNHLRHLDPALTARALNEMARPAGPFVTMEDWLRESFGPTLADMFFIPFHGLYTAGLSKTIAPQDAYKSPVNLSLVVQGALQESPPVGYNAEFLYPVEGLNLLARRMADRCEVQYGRRVVAIDTRKKTVRFADGNAQRYGRLISTLPLSQMMELSDVAAGSTADPHTSVLVLNIGARKGPRCPLDHWVYVPNSDGQFHRVGFYSNVDSGFLPVSARSEQSHVCIYVEKAFLPQDRPTPQAVTAYSERVVAELQRWGFIAEVEVVHPTWIEVAYTWSWPESGWKREALRVLEQTEIYQVGRYGRWIFQGIADSIRDGFIAGSSFRD